MSAFRLILRAIEHRRLSSLLTTLAVAVGVMLVTCVLLLQAAVQSHFREPGRGYQLVVGPPGSRLQLVLNAIFHLDESPGLMPMRVWRELEENPSVALAVPYAVGDSFMGYRVVATTEAFFDARFPHPEDDKLADGRVFEVNHEALDTLLRPHDEQYEDEDEHEQHEGEDEHEHDEIREAVLGARVARELGIVVGSQIEPTHGLGSAAGRGIDTDDAGHTPHAHAQFWEVVGVLEETGTPIDGLVLINLDSFYAIAEHAEGAVIPGTEDAALSAVVVFPRAGIHKVRLLSSLNRNPDVQVADVNDEIDTLFSIVGSVDGVLLLLSILITIMGVLTVLIALTNSMNERMRELAIFRAMGASRRTLFSLVVGEALLLVLAGSAFGIALGHGLLFALGPSLEQAAGVAPDPFTFVPVEGLVVLGVIILAALAAAIPARRVVTSDLAKALKS